MVTRTLAALVLSGPAVLAAQRPEASQAQAAARPPAREVARVNGTAISSDRVDAALAALIPMESFHRTFSDEKRAALRRRAVQSLVDEELQLQEGVRQTVPVSDADVQTVWDEMVPRYGGTQRFERVLRQSGSSPAEARTEFRRMATIRKIYAREVTAKCAVTRQHAADYFAANPDRFVEPEQLHVHAITIAVDPSSTAQQWAAARSRAEDALRRLQSGTAFTEVVDEYSTDPSRAKGGDMGFLHRGSLTAPFEEIATRLPVGQVSEVTETLYGYHIIRVSEIRPAQPKRFEEVADTLQSDLTTKRCDARKDTWLAELRARAHITVDLP